jgi:ABC-type branched-chain amino acid transport systems, ATPase component
MSNTLHPLGPKGFIPERDLDKTPILETHHLGIDFGGLTAVNEFEITIGRTEITGLIGPNGAGKTTVFNLLTNVYKPTRGNILLDGVSTAGKSTAQLCRMGIARTFQNIRLFKSQTAFENVLIATHLRRTSNVFTAMFRLNAKEEKKNREKAMELLRIVGLEDAADEKATSLPYGKQRRLEIARALATEPTLLLLDEPAAGMNPQETLELGQFIQQIKRDFGLTVFVIEHHMDLVMNISDRIYVIEFGKQIAEGTPEEIQNDQAVIEAYLGGNDE